MRDTIVHAAEGALGGALGTLFIQQEMALTEKLPERFKPTSPTRDPGEHMMNALQERLPRKLPERISATLAKSLHPAYGIFWGVLFGLLSPRFASRGAARTVAAGALLGATVWAAGYVGWLPALRLTPPVHRQGAGHVLTDCAMHIGYGLVAALPVALIEHRRKNWPRRLIDRLFDRLRPLALR